MFTQGFDDFVCDRDTITCVVDGMTCTASVYLDDVNEAPWERDCGHGSVSDWTTRDKRPGELVLCEDRRSRRYYDFQEAVKTARHDGWGIKDGRKEGESLKAYAARAAMQDFKVLKAWCDDEWHYYGVAVTVERADVELVGQYDHALWGIEGNYPGSDNSYLQEVANELLGDALASARAKLTELCDCPA
jgi:hypothetical protein